jgi:hypothetical protein
MIICWQIDFYSFWPQKEQNSWASEIRAEIAPCVCRGVILPPPPLKGGIPPNNSFRNFFTRFISTLTFCIYIQLLLALNAAALIMLERTHLGEPVNSEGVSSPDKWAKAWRRPFTCKRALVLSRRKNKNNIPYILTVKLWFLWYCMVYAILFIVPEREIFIDRALWQIQQQTANIL